MKTKISLSLFLLFLLFHLPGITSAQAQYLEVNDVVLNVASTKILSNTIRLNESQNTVDLKSIKGSPYENDEFLMGRAMSDNLNISNPYFMRYNIYNDVIEIKDKEQSVEMSKSSDVYALINDREYHYESYSDESGKLNKGYFILLYKGEQLALYVRKTQRYKDVVKAKTSYHQDVPAAFVDSKDYSMKKEGKMEFLSRNKKELTRQFPSLDAKLKSYIKTNRINVNDDADMIRLFAYIDQELK